MTGRPAARSAASILVTWLAAVAAQAQSPAPPADGGTRPAAEPAKDPGLHFTDVLEASNIRFRHHFLDSESGTNFRVNPYDHGSGMCVADVNGDGLDDLYFLDFLGPAALYLNRGGMKFEDVTAQAGVALDRAIKVAAAFGDYDNDGDLDLYVTTYRGGNHLFQNDGHGVFTDVTKKAGVAYTGHSSAVTWFDRDGDGDLDLYVSNMFGGDHLYRNGGDGKFEEITTTALGRTSWGSMGARFFDADGDELPDLYVVDMHSDMWLNPDERDRVTSTVKYNTPAGTNAKDWKAITSPEQTHAHTVLFGNTFFRNRGDGKFEERSAQANLETWFPWGIAVGDFDDDGAEDLYVPTGMGYPYYFWPNAFLRNDGKGVFREQADEVGLGIPAKMRRIEGTSIKGSKISRSSRAAAVSDLDGDGDLDLVVNNFNHEPYLYRNDSPPRHALRLQLRNRAKSAAWGARVRVVTAARTWSRELANAQGYLTQSSAVLHVGLGAVAAVERVEIFWPGSRTPQVVAAPPLDRVVVVDQQ